MLAGKVVLITGATSGIGAETARLLAAKGAIPVLTGRRTEQLLNVSSSLGDSKHGYYEMDVRSAEQIEAVTRQTVETFGRIDVLLNNAGFGQFARFEDMPTEDFFAMMDTNYLGVVRCTKAVLPIMREQGTGHIVNVASMAGKLSTAKASAYAATKHAVLGLTNSLRFELAADGIAVSAVNPGPIDTPFLQQADPGGSYKESVRGYMLRPAQVAEAIVKVIKRRTAEVDLPLSAGLGIRLYSMAPRLADKIAGKMLNRK